MVFANMRKAFAVTLGQSLSHMVYLMKVLHFLDFALPTVQVEVLIGNERIVFLDSMKIVGCVYS